MNYLLEVEVMGYQMAYSPRNEAELAVLRMRLDQAGIRYVVQSDQAGSVYPGTQLDGFNSRYILVWEDDLPHAKTIIDRCRMMPERPSDGSDK